MLDYQRLFDKYFVRLSTFAYRWVGNEDDAKDLVQDAFVVLMQRQESIPAEGSVIKAFLYTTVKNLALKHIRNSQSSSKAIDQSLLFQEESEDSILNSIIESEVIGQLHEDIEELPVGCQHILKLLYLEGMSYEEVASTFDISINTVKTQRARAIRMLREKFLMGIIFLFSCFAATYMLFQK